MNDTDTRQTKTMETNHTFDQQKPGFFRLWWIAARPYSLTASTMPVIFGTAMAATMGGAEIRWLRFAAAFFGMVLLHVGANLVNDGVDFTRGFDRRVNPVSGAVVRGWITPKQAFAAAGMLFALGTVLLAVLVVAVGIPILWIGLAAWVPAGAGAPPPKPPKSGTARFGDDTANSIDPGDLIPSDRRTTWNPGVPGGIPKAATIFANINAATYGNGVADAQAVINNAIAAAGAVATENNRQVVFLPQGTYRITGAIGLFSSHVVLRGAGPDKTRIRLDSSTPTSVIQFGVPGFWPSYSPAIDVTADAAKGSRQITVADAGARQVGDVLQIDQVDDPTYINRLPDGVYHKRQLNEDVNGPAREAGEGTGAEETGWRSESQQIEVAAKNGKTLLLAGPLHRSFLLRRKPQVFKSATARQGEPGIRYAGVEDLSFSGGGTPGDGQPAIWLLNAAYCWVKNVEGDGRPDTALPGTYANPGGMTGIHVQLSHAYRCEVHQAAKDNTVWYDDVVLSTGYIGPRE